MDKEGYNVCGSRSPSSGLKFFNFFVNFKHLKTINVSCKIFNLESPMVTVTNDIVVILHSNSNHVTDKGKRAFKIVLKKTQECFENNRMRIFLKLKKIF